MWLTIATIRPSKCAAKWNWLSAGGMRKLKRCYRISCTTKTTSREDTMMKRLFAIAIAAAFIAGSVPRDGRAQETKQATELSVIVFPGVQNLPMFAAQAKGLYAKRGLSVDLKFTPNSDELRNGLAEGRYQIAHSAVDNAFALKDKTNVDIAVVIGGDNSFNHLMVQADISSFPTSRAKRW